MAPQINPARQVTVQRLRSRGVGIALGVAMVAAIGQALSTVVAGQIAQGPSSTLVAWLALLTVGPALLGIGARVLWYAAVDRAEGKLRADLLTAALDQPLADLSEQAAGEILDRVDDDTHEVGSLLRGQAWQAIATLCGLIPMWLVAGFTWWPGFILLPVMAALMIFAIRPLLGKIAKLKVIEEIAWTDNAAALEEGIAARNDLRTSLGQGHMVSRFSALSADVHQRFLDVIRIESRVVRICGLLLHTLLVVVAIAGVLLVEGGRLEVAELVTLFLVTTAFVGQVNQVGNHIPDLQAGVGAVIRLRQLLEVAPEPVGGARLPSGSLSLEIRDLSFKYAEGTFGIRDLSLSVPAGETLALVGRSGSGKSTLAALFSRAVEPPVGTVFLGGVDVTTLDLEHLRGSVGVVTQRTEIVSGTLAQNIALFADTAAAQIQGAVTQLGLDEWVAGLDDGLDTLLGPGGTGLSAGEEQLVAFARLLVRDVQVVVLDEATARMDPVTEARVVAAAERLLVGRTGVIIAHRLSTIERAHWVGVLEAGRLTQFGERRSLAVTPGAFADLLAASSAPSVHQVAVSSGVIGRARRMGPAPAVLDPGTGPGLAKATSHALLVRPWWGLISVLTFFWFCPLHRPRCGDRFGLGSDRRGPAARGNPGCAACCVDRGSLRRVADAC